MKRALSLILTLFFAFLLFVSCAENENTKDTSAKSSSSKKQVSSVMTSSKQGVNRPQEGENTSQTSSESTKVAVSPQNAANIGVYHFNEKWTTNLGKGEDIGFFEFESVLKEGYFNTVIVEKDTLKKEKFWDICRRYNVTVWMDMWTYFDSSRWTIEEYFSTFDEIIQNLRYEPDKWERFLGFHFEEYVWRGQTNEDYLAQSRELYTRYGKRNYAVFATGEFTGVEGNEHLHGTAADESKKMLTSSLKYTTDVGFDSYGVDVRDGAPEVYHKEIPAIVDGKSYYKELADLLLRITGHPANLWFYPTAYTCRVNSGLDGTGIATESYCTAHLSYMYELLEQYEYKGGLMLYTYTQFDNKEEVGLKSHLVLRNASGEHMIDPDINKWTYYSKLIKRITEDYKYNARKTLNSLQENLYA